MRFLSLILFASYIQSTDYIDYPHPFHPTTSSSGMVVSQSALSSDIGVKILDMGGNAVDAAVAVGFSLATTLPRAGNLGGGGFMLVERTDLRVASKNAVFEVSEAKRWLLGGYNHGTFANMPYPIAMEQHALLS